MPGETVLITGASSGIGRDLARLFAADADNLVLVARSEAKLQELADELRKRHAVEIKVLPADLSDHQTPQRLSERLAADGVRIDVVVNNAGFGAAGSFAALDLQRQLDMLQVNIVALTHLTRLFIPGMLQRRRGGILNVGSTAAFQPGPLMAIYYATKAFVLSFTEALAEEVAGSGVHVTCLAPGPTTTGFADAAAMQESLLFRLAPMPSTTVARIGYRGFRRGKVLVVPGIHNRIVASSVRFLPRIVVRKLAKQLQKLPDR